MSVKGRGAFGVSAKHVKQRTGYEEGAVLIRHRGSGPGGNWAGENTRFGAARSLVGV